MNTDRFNKILAVTIAFGLVVAAMESYVVRELAAALAMFAVLFSAAGTALLVMVAIEESISTGITHLEARLVRVRARNREK
jgi:uncharacterized membrane protein